MLAIDRFVVEEELPRKEVAYVLAGHDDGRGDVPHVVFTAIQPELARGQARRKARIAFHAMTARLRIRAVKSRANFLPTNADEHPPLQIDETHGNMHHRVEVVHELLESLGVDQIVEFKLHGIAIGREQAVEFCPHEWHPAKRFQLSVRKIIYR